MVFENKTIGNANEFLKGILIREETNWTEYRIKVLNEDEKSKYVDKIVTRLFNDIKSKAMDVDFDFIDASKGNITKLKNYQTIDNAIKYLQKIIISDPNVNKQVPEMKKATEELSKAFNTLKKYSREFELGFKMNNAVIRYLYDSLVVALIQGTSFVVSESVEFVKDNLNLYKANVKRSNNIAKNNHIKAIASFNELERKGQLVKFFKDTQQFKENAFVAIGKNTLGLLGGMTGVGKFIAILGLIGFVLALIRSIIFMYYNSRVKLSQYLKHLKEFVEMNASTIGPDAKHVKEKQMKVAKTLEKLSDIISVDQNVSNDRTTSQIDESNKILAIQNSDPITSNSSSNPVLDLY